MLIFLVAAIGILSVPERARAQQPPTYAITHAKIVSLASSPIEGGTLVIRMAKSRCQRPRGSPQARGSSMAKACRSIRDYLIRSRKWIE
jgi:hypothetical protein